VAMLDLIKDTTEYDAAASRAQRCDDHRDE
jgi:hypothetical protein